MLSEKEILDEYSMLLDVNMIEDIIIEDPEHANNLTPAPGPSRRE